MDLETLSLADLKALRSRVERAIVSFEDRKKKEAAKQLEEKARELGYSLNELANLAPAKPRKAVEPKYANPQDRTQTWSGRGRKPLWVQAALTSGKSLDDLKI